jgi:type I restriction-modification system DNA methylase subunit
MKGFMTNLKKKDLNARIEKNLKALEVLTKQSSSLDKEESKTILNGYSGWGGLRDAIFTPSIYGQLRKHLTVEEIEEIKATTKSAYYTPELLVKFIWSVLNLGNIKSGIVLEPAAGNGVFLDYMPSSIAKSCKIETVEMDLLTCKILAQKHPKIKITAAVFENLYFGNTKYDLIVSNPPYSSQLINDIQFADLAHLAIHHYFVAKCARLLKNNGIVAMVLPTFFLDNVRDHARDIIAADGVNLMFAYRLPDDLFSNAKVTVDIVFLKKGETGIKWQKTQDIKIGEKTKAINEYFIAHPENILGELKIIPMYGRFGITCKAQGDLREQLINVFKIHKKTTLSS